MANFKLTQSFFVKSKMAWASGSVGQGKRNSVRRQVKLYNYAQVNARGFGSGVKIKKRIHGRISKANSSKGGNSSSQESSVEPSPSQSPNKSLDTSPKKVMRTIVLMGTVQEKKLINLIMFQIWKGKAHRLLVVVVKWTVRSWQKRQKCKSRSYKSS